jgi:hypothetical protein
MKKRTRREASFAHWRLLAQGPGRRYLHLRAQPKDKHSRAFEREYPGVAKEFADTWLKDAPHFDELVISSPDVHLERMDSAELFVALGEAKFAVWVDRAGKTRVRLYEGTHDPATGEIHEHGWTKGVRRK